MQHMGTMRNDDLAEKIRILKSKVRTIPDFPKEGILFYDITTLLKDTEGLKLCIDSMHGLVKDLKVDKVAAIESRGFIFAVPLALRLGCGFVPIRKPGKLPDLTISQEYALEYGTNKIEIHKDAIKPGEKVLLVDDLIATGGTAKAACTLVERLGGKVSCFLFAIELESLPGREALKGYEVRSLLKY